MLRARLLRRPRRLDPLPPTPASAIETIGRDACRHMGQHDEMPEEVRRAVAGCEFKVDLQRLPSSFAWKKVGLVEKIRAIKTFEDAAAFDRWLLQVGLRRPR